jgi:hypothetical protein
MALRHGEPQTHDNPQGHLNDAVVASEIARDAGSD